MADEKHALYLTDPDTGRVSLIHADDVEDKRKAGWKDPEGQRANGGEWNSEEDLAGQDFAADFAKQKEEADAKKAEKDDAERQKAEKEADKAAEATPAKPDLKVEVIDPKKSTKK